MPRENSRKMFVDLRNEASRHANLEEIQEHIIDFKAEITNEY